MISGMPNTKDTWVLYYWLVNELRITGYDEDFIAKILAKPPHIPRETCSNCGITYPGKAVKLTPAWECRECGRSFKVETIPPKTKHKEVFENVKWVRGSSAGWIHPYIVKAPFAFDKFLWKDTKVIIEWEE